MPGRGREARTRQDHCLSEERRSEMGGQDRWRLDAEGGGMKGGLQEPGTQLPSDTRSLLVSTSTSVGGQGAAEAGTVISSHLDCFGATKARRDGHLGSSQTRTPA